MKGLLHLYLKDIKAHRVALAAHAAVAAALVVGPVLSFYFMEKQLLAWAGDGYGYKK